MYSIFVIRLNNIT